MSKQTIRDTLESLCLDSVAIDLVMVRVNEFELEIERRRDARREEELRGSMKHELKQLIDKLK